MKKKLLFTLMIFTMGLSFTACGKQTTPEPAAAPEEETVTEEAVTEEAEDTEEEASDDEEYTEIGAWTRVNKEELDGETIEWNEYLVFNRDGSGYWIAQDCTTFTYGDGVLLDGSDDPVYYELNKDELTLQRLKFEETYTRIDGAWPEELDETIAEYENYITQFMPNDFLQERLQKDTFESYDEVVDALEPGEAYAYVQFKDYDSDFLVITDNAYEDGGIGVATVAYVYGDIDGVVKNIGNCFGAEGYPIKTDGEMFYTASADGYEVDCLDKDNCGLMVMEQISGYEDESGNMVYDGFRRNDNSVAEDGEDLEFDDAEIFADLIENYNTQKPVNFFIIK